MAEEKDFARTSFQTDPEIFKQFKLWTVKNDISIRDYVEQEVRRYIAMREVSKESFNIDLSSVTTKPFAINRELLKQLNTWLVEHDITLKNLMNKIMSDALK